MSTIPRIEWPEFRERFRWKQGEHISAIAPAGAGKTTLLHELIPYRGYNVFFATKPDDPLYRKILREGFRRIETFDQVRPFDKNVMLWPKLRKTIPETMLAQRIAFQDALNTVVHQKSWTLWIDEAKYMTEMLKLGSELTYSIEQLRSVNATVICGAQRPAWVPRAMLANTTHAFLWKSTNRDDATRLADLGGVDARMIREEMRMLDHHEFIYIKTRGTEVSAVRSEVKVN